MAGKNHNAKNPLSKKNRNPTPSRLPSFAKGYLLGVLLVSLFVLVLLSFFGLAGSGGQKILSVFSFLLGGAAFLLPFFLLITSLLFLVAASDFSRIWRMVFLALFSCVLGSASLLSSFSFSGRFLLKEAGYGGLLGQVLSFPVLKFFGLWVNLTFFLSVVAFGFLIFWRLAQKVKPQEAEEMVQKSSLFRKIFEPKLKVKEVPDNQPFVKQENKAVPPPELKAKPVGQGGLIASVYRKPEVGLLEPDRGTPITGDIRNNMAVIKKTLETFGIPVEMGEVNIGPTVTQYTLKPAEGIKLSKITTLSNDLSLALAVHPLRIEAPIPGKPLVGIEVPNKARTQVRLRNLFETEDFKRLVSPLALCLGRDVAGNPCFAELGRMPHLLVAGSTGSGKTICLNTIILSLIYRNSPEILRFILVDPKRVEFPVYQDLPHLLSPVIFDSQKTVNALKWLVKEMERRFEVLAAAKARDIWSYNNNILKQESVRAEEDEAEIMPYIVVVVDELADLMAARGKEVEAGIVRLAQMARAVGIHLVVATQRPSVEVITGLIKANITARVSFQVASQVDSRTVLDMAGAEKLLGSGDLLFVSAETSKPRRIQGAYVTDKEVRRVVDFLKTQKPGLSSPNFLAEELERELETPAGEPTAEQFLSEEDPLYLSAKQLVVESRKASASLLQRRLRVGYARAARLLDILEERGVVGPADGAKPREVFVKEKPLQTELGVSETGKEAAEEDKDGWSKV